MLNHTPFDTNGTTPPTSESESLSPEYLRLKAGMDAWEMWQELDDTERREYILDLCPPFQWFEDDYLPTLALFRHDSVQWGRIKAKGRDCGVHVGDLETAVDDYLKTHQASTPRVPDTPPTPLHTMTAHDLYVKDLPPLDYIIKDILPVGATLFVGRAKDGKSLAMWNLCLAVAEGGLAFGRYQAQQGDVLYMALEDGERRAQKRLREQMQAMGTATPPARLEFVLWEAPRLGEGLEEALHGWLDAHAGAKLVVIDILEKVRPRRTRHGSVYADDYNAIAPLQRIAQERNIALIIVHHANKVKAEDFRETPSGSMSLTGACDTLWVLQRLAGEADAVLKITGRDIETQELALQFADGFWTALGDAHDYRISQASKAVLEALHDAGKPLTPKQLAQILHLPVGTVRVRLFRMVERGEVLTQGDGRYLPRMLFAKNGQEGVSPVMPVTPVTLDPDMQECLDTSGEEPQGVTAEDPTEGNSDVTHLSDEKERGLGAFSSTVTGVTPGDKLPTQDVLLPEMTLPTPPTMDTPLELPRVGDRNNAVDPECPRCHHRSCVALAGRGRVCMRCRYCERPDEGSEILG